MTRRFVTLFVAFLAGIVLSAGLVGSASAKGDEGATASKAKPGKKHHKKRNVKPKVAILSRDATGLSRGNLKVRVVAPRKSRVWLSSTSSTFDVPKSRLSKGRSVRIGHKGRRVVTLKLTSAAKTAVAGCEARTLTVTAKRGKRKATTTRSMNRNSDDCDLAPVNLARAADCDFIAKPKEGMCMLPFPNDYYTRADTSSPTGKRLDLTTAGLPANNEGVHIDASGWNLSDGFSQGSGITVKIPGLDTLAAVTKNNLVPINHQGDYNLPDQRVLVIDADTGERWPVWANIDANATAPKDAVLEIKPSKNFDAGSRYIVALRNLTDASGAPLTAPTAFRYYRDDLPSAQDEINARRDHFEGIFDSLRKADVKRNDLYLAWDFTTASDENNYKRVLSMRDRAFEELGDTNLGDNVVQGDSPEFTIDDSKTEDFSSAEDPQVARKVNGTYRVPCYLWPSCAPGGTMDLDSKGLPKRNGYWDASLSCIIPRAALDGAPQEMRPLVFGHGLFGNAPGVDGSVNPQIAQDHEMVICATDEIGMSLPDVPTVSNALFELSKFKVLPDRLAQGLLNELYLARLMYHPDGLGSDPDFQNAGQPILETENVYYMGASQGGIMGGALTAISPDFTQASLLVGAMNYSMLLPRSSDFDIYARFLYPAYPNEMSRSLLFSLMQILWDRSEPNGYTHVMTDKPPPDTPKHKVSLIIALGDHEVSNFAAEVEARSLGMKTPAPVLDAARWPDHDVLWNVPRLKTSDYPYHGSNIVYFDGGPVRPDPNDPSKTIGTTPPPFANVPNRAGQNPHGAPGGATKGVEMISSFLQPNGYIDHICAPKSCYSDVWNGLP